MMDRNTTTILGVPIDQVTMEDAVCRAKRFVDGYKKGDIPSYIATVNLDFLVSLHSPWQRSVANPELFRFLLSADMNTADGMPLIWYNQLVGGGIPERVSGSDLVPRLLASLACEGKKVFLLGSTEEIIAEASRVIKERFSDLRLVGSACPVIKISQNVDIDAERRDRSIVEQINAARPDLLLISLGNPKQEWWFSRNRYRLDVPLSIGIGGALAFLSGDRKRAPRWMQRLGLEWLHRFLQEPLRLGGRYLTDGVNGTLLMTPSILYFLLQRAIQRISSKVHVGSRAQGNVIYDVSGKTVGYCVRLASAMTAAEAMMSLEAFGKQTGLSLLLIDLSNWKLANIHSVNVLVALFKSCEERDIRCVVVGQKFWLGFLIGIHRLKANFDRCVLTTEPISAAAAILKIHRESQFLYLCQQSNGGVEVMIFGKIVGVDAAEALKRKILALAVSEVTINGSFCTTVDKSAAEVLLNLRATFKANGGTLRIGFFGGEAAQHFRRE